MKPPKVKIKVPPLSGVAAPDVMTRSQITDLANRVRQSEGQFGAQRVERAADEIPNLEKLYQEQALMRAFTGDNAQGLMTMKPSDFERYAATLGLSDRSLQNISHLTNVQTSGGFSDVPYLNINKKEQGTMGLPYIAGHEGRHRNRAMDAAGEQAGLVQLVPRSELREPFPRRSREDYLEALYKEMQLTDNRVMPEAYYLDVQRPAIDLPEFYAQGGLVDSAPEEAIKNTITDPQAFRMLDMDLANLALMSQKPQPQRMAEGGAVHMNKGGDVLKALAALLNKSQGAHGAQRLERVADLIPNLENLYTQQALKDAFTQKNALTIMPPSDFGKLAERLRISENGGKQSSPASRLKDMSLDEYVAQLNNVTKQGGFDSTPQLWVGRFDDYIPHIAGHEGRHRSLALDSLGQPNSLVQVLQARTGFSLPSGKDKMPAKLGEKYIQKMNDFVGEQRLVTPEGGSLLPKDLSDPQYSWLKKEGIYDDNVRALPELFNEGGAVHMEDGGLLSNIYRKVVPAHLRTFGETLMGDRTPITEKNFTPSELDQMRTAVMSSRKDREAMNQRMFANTIDKEFRSGASDKELMAIMSKGPSQKIDQSVGYQHYPGGDIEVRRDTDFGHDASIRSTLGRFAYNKDANGNLIATDNYKFTNDLPDDTRPTSDYAGMSTPEKLWLLAKDTAQLGGLETLPSRVGNAFIGADGRPVNVNLGAAPFAQGGAVRMEHGGITPRAFSYSPTDRDEHNRKLGLPAEFYRAGQADPTMQSYGAGVSVPVGGARLTADAIAARNAQMRDTLAGIMLGAEFPVGEGTLRAETMRPTMQGASPTYGLRYNQRFANGGQVQRFDEGGEVSQSELDRMRFELAQAQNPSSPVMQATPRGAIQDFIGTAGGYMDQAGKFVSEAIAPTAKKHPVKHFLADLILASSLKSAGTALQDYTGTARETDEDNPVRGVIDKDWRKLSTSTEPLLDPRALDIAGFATPVVRGATKLVGAGAKAIEPFATRVDDMVRELYTSGAMPQPGLSIKDVTPKPKPAPKVAEEVVTPVRTPEEQAVIDKFGQKHIQEAARTKKVEKANLAESEAADAADAGLSVPVAAPAPKTKGTNRGAVPADFYRKMADVKGDAAVIKAAQAGQHLKPTESGYIGAPRTVTSPQGLGAMRRAIDKDFIDSVEAVRLADPTRLGTWYDRAKQGIGSTTEPYQLNRVLEQHGVYSAGVSPESELAFALKHLNSRAAGEPAMAYRGAGMRTLDNAVAEDRAAKLGFKIGEYANKNDPLIPNEGLFGVNDFRRAQGMGYTDPQGNPWKAGVSTTMHPFMDAETALQVDRANLAGVGGRTDWAGPHIQEVPWVYGKAQDFHARGKKGRYKGDELEGIKQSLVDANNTARDYMYKHAMSATHEAIPGASLNHVPQALNMTPAEKLAYSRTGRWDRPVPESGALSGVGEGNRDVLYSALGYRQLPSIESQGFYTNKLGGVETNPMTIARPLMDFPTGGGGGKISPLSDQVAQAVEQFRSLNSAQEAGAFNLPNTMNSVKSKNSMVLDTRHMNPNKLQDPTMGVPPTAEQLSKMSDLMGDHGFGVSATTRGVSIFPYDPNMNPKDASKVFKKTRAELERIYPSNQMRGITTTGYVPGVGKRNGLQAPLSTEPYSGEATSDMLSQFAKLHPKVALDISESEAVRSAIREQALRDSLLGKTRGDIQKTRQFFSEADWPRAVELIRKGATPAAAMAALGYSASSMAGEKK